MLDRLISAYPHVAAFFYDDADQNAKSSLEALETIDDDLYAHSGIKLVKIDDPEEAVEYGLDKLPKLVFFENQMPNIYEGNLADHDQVFQWITEIAMESRIELVTGAMLEKLIEDNTDLAVFVHDR